MVFPPEVEAKKVRHAEFMHGFRKGVSGAYIPDLASPDMKRGYEEGRKAVNAAHSTFCKEIDLDPYTLVLR